MNNIVNKSVWIVFTGKTDITWTKFLKKEFRHCFAVIKSGDRWMSIDPLSAFTDIQIYDHLDAKFDLPDWLKKQGYKVVPYIINHNHKKSAPFMPFTCVEAVKRILGLHQRFILTPWQLYQYLNKNNEFKTMKGEKSWVV